MAALVCESSWDPNTPAQTGRPFLCVKIAFACSMLPLACRSAGNIAALDYFTMTGRTSMGEEVGQKEHHFKSTSIQVERHKSYDLTQRLTFFVIGLEGVFCGYILLNARALAHIHGLQWLFLSCSLALVMGIVWRFGYNETFHRSAHGSTDSTWFLLVSKIQRWSYIFYVLLFLISLIAAIVMGFIYIQNSRAPLIFV